MMATSMGPNFTGGHPAGMGHPGVPGHVMGPGMPHNPGQQGAPAGAVPPQFGAGPMAVSAPGGQIHPSMMSMPPGAGPHGPAALQHMTPQQQQQFLQQQQFQNQFHNNPNAMVAMRQQQQLFQHQQHARQMMAAQQAYGANFPGGNMQMGMPMNAQIHQLRQTGRIPPQLAAQQYALHQQQQQAQQAQQAQQQAQQAQQGQQQGPPQGPHPQQQPGPNGGQAVPMTAQNLQSMQSMAAQQGQIAGQHAQQPPQGQTPQVHTPSQQQPQPPPPGQQQPHHTPQQQTSQAGTPGPGQQTPSQTPNSTPVQLGPGQQQGQPPQAQQPQQPPQPQGPQGQPHLGQQGQPQGQPPQGAGVPQPGQVQGGMQVHGPPQQGQHLAHPQMTAAAQQLAFQNTIMAQQRQRQAESLRGQYILKLVQFGEQLSSFPGTKTKDDLTYWNAFVERFFAPEGIFRHSLHVTDASEPAAKQYEIAYPAIARYFHTHFGSGVRHMQLVLDRTTIDRPMPQDGHFIENPKASLVYWFETGSHLVAQGTLRAYFNAQQKLELLEFVTTSHEEYVSRKQVIEAAKPAHNWIKDWRNVNNSDSKQSPELSKKGKGKQLKSPQTHPPEVLVDLPDTAVNSKGVTAAVHQFLEIVEVMGQMNPLFGFYHATPGLGPYAALEQYVATNINGAPGAGAGPGAPGGMNGQPGQVPGQVPRTPSFSQFPMGASPAPGHMNLPGSPHVVGGSPIPVGQMHQAPAMQMQQSQQGTNTSSGGPSANTSPMSNKRRRPSGVKTEDDSGPTGPGGASTPQMNGLQGVPRPGKPSTPRMNKRAKTNQS